jgi:hypothetical protein
MRDGAHRVLALLMPTARCPHRDRASQAAAQGASSGELQRVRATRIATEARGHTSHASRAPR